MTEQTYNIIMAIKNIDQPWNQAIAKYMSKETGTPEYLYGETLINKVLKDAVIDYFTTCDHPYAAMDVLLKMLMDSGGHSFGFVVADYLHGVCMRMDGVYINGFGKFKEHI